MFFFWFFPIFVSNHDITFVHLSISKRQPSSRFCEDFLFFIPAASGLMALSKMWEIQIGSQCSSEIMQDGDFLRFFFQIIIAGNFFWPSHLSSPKCLHIRHKDIFILSSLFFWDFWKQNCKMCFLVGDVFFVWDLQYCNQRGVETIRIKQKVFRMLIFLCFWKRIFFSEPNVLKKPDWTPLHNFLTMFGKKWFFQEIAKNNQN